MGKLSICFVGLKGVLVGLEGVLTGLKGVLTGLKGVLTGLKGVLTGLNGVLAGLEGVLMGLRGVLAGLEGVLTGLEGFKFVGTIGIAVTVTGSGRRLTTPDLLGLTTRPPLRGLSAPDFASVFEIISPGLGVIWWSPTII